MDGVSTPQRPASIPASSHGETSLPVRAATAGVDGGVLASFSKMADAITELHKLLRDERIKNETLFQENFGPKMEIENLRTIEREASSKAFVSETIVNNSSIEKVECPSNKDALSSVDQQQCAQQSQKSQVKKKKKKRGVNKPTRGNVTDGETVHQSADQINSLSDVNLSSAPATTSTADDKCNNNHNNVNKVGAVQKTSPAPAPSPPPAADNNNNCNNRHIRSEKPQPEGPEYWKKNTVLIVGDSMLKNINEWTLSRRYTTKVRCFCGSTVDDLQDYIKVLMDFATMLC